MRLWIRCQRAGEKKCSQPLELVAILFLHLFLPENRLYWVPLHCVTFSVIPKHIRVAFVSAGATGYVTVLSYITAALDKKKLEAGKEEMQNG